SSERLPGEWGRDDAGARMVTADDDRVVGVWPDRARVATAAGTGAEEIGGVGFVRPVIDIDGTSWLVDRVAGSARVRVHDGDTFSEVPSPGLPEVSSFAISPDGARYAATAAGRLLIGAVQR